MLSVAMGLHFIAAILMLIHLWRSAGVFMSFHNETMGWKSFLVESARQCAFDYSKRCPVY